MPITAVNITLLFPSFLIVLFRIGGLTLSAPLLGSSGVPARLKIAFSFVLALMVFPIVFPSIPKHLPLHAVLVTVFGELMIGFILGLSVGIIFLGARLTGMIIGQQAGIALGRVINPMLDAQTTILGQVYFLIFMMIFFAAGGHRAMVSALLGTFQSIPPGSFRFNASFLTLFERLLTDAFKIAMRLSAPALIALFMASLTMGFLSRTIPQLNVLTVGFAVRVSAALGVAGLALPYAFDLLHNAAVDTLVLVRTAFGVGP